MWYGSDEDGDVVSFEVAVVRELERGAAFDPDTLHWTPTASTESTFVVAADSCCHGGETRHDPQYAGAYWGILIRSLDNGNLPFDRACQHFSRIKRKIRHALQNDDLAEYYVISAVGTYRKSYGIKLDKSKIILR